jgi:hypothetical protein
MCSYFDDFASIVTANIIDVPHVHNCANLRMIHEQFVHYLIYNEWYDGGEVAASPFQEPWTVNAEVKVWITMDNVKVI